MSDTPDNCRRYATRMATLMDKHRLIVKSMREVCASVLSFLTPSTNFTSSRADNIDTISLLGRMIALHVGDPNAIMSFVRGMCVAQAFLQMDDLLLRITCMHDALTVNSNTEDYDRLTDALNLFCEGLNASMARYDQLMLVESVP